jgi:hypothetical protein
MDISGEDKVYSMVMQKLRALSDDEIFEMSRNIHSENFHPDIEFASLGLEGRITDVALIDAVLAEEDERRRRIAKTTQNNTVQMA